MKKQWLPLLFLPLGILIGYLIPHSSQNSTAEENPSQVRPDRPNRPGGSRSSTASETTRISAIVLSLQDMDPKQRESFTNEVALEDIPGLLNSLLQQAGPDGIDYQTREIYNRMMLRWASEDFPGALAWADRHPVAAVRRNALRAILSERIADDYDGTLALYLQYRDKENLDLYMSYNFFQEAVKAGPQAAFDLLLNFQTQDGGANGGDGGFPQGFDYPAFMSLVADHYLSRPEGSTNQFSYFPSDVLEEWAKIDRDAALDFFLKAPDISFQEFSEVGRQFIDFTDIKSSVSWLENQIRTATPENRKRILGDAGSLFPDEMGVSPFLTLVDGISDEPLKREVTGQLLRSLGRTSRSNGPNPYLLLINTFPDSATKLKLLKEQGAERVFHELPDKQLSEYGLSREMLESP